MIRSAKRLLSILENRFEKIFWQFRLIGILPVLMTALSSLATFVLGTRETFNALETMLNSSGAEQKVLARVLGGFIGGVDLYLIGIALLIFSYGTYELLISAIDPARSEGSKGFKGVLEVASLDDLKKKLVKVLVIALVVFAFKAMLALPLSDGISLLYYCVSLLLLSLSSYLVGKLGH